MARFSRMGLGKNAYKYIKKNTPSQAREVAWLTKDKVKIYKNKKKIQIQNWLANKQENDWFVLDPESIQILQETSIRINPVPLCHALMNLASLISQ